MTNSCGMFSAVFRAHPFAILRPERGKKDPPGSDSFPSGRETGLGLRRLLQPIRCGNRRGRMAIATHRPISQTRPQAI